jgi:hypothetical protein
MLIQDLCHRTWARSIYTYEYSDNAETVDKGECNTWRQC